MVGTGLASEQQRGSGSNERALGPRPFHTRGAPLSFPYRLPHVSRKGDREQNWYIDHTRRRRERDQSLSQNQERERGKKAGWTTGRSSARKSVGWTSRRKRRRESEERMRSREGEREWEVGRTTFRQWPRWSSKPSTGFRHKHIANEQKVSKRSSLKGSDCYARRRQRWRQTGAWTCSS